MTSSVPPIALRAERMTTAALGALSPRDARELAGNVAQALFDGVEHAPTVIRDAIDYRRRTFDLPLTTAQASDLEWNLLAAWETR